MSRLLSPSSGGGGGVCGRQRFRRACRRADGRARISTSRRFTKSLKRHTAEDGISPVFQDFREQYPEATRRSKALGMYRQNYCGCAFSKVEAAEEREQRKAERAAAKAKREEELAPQRAAGAAARAARKAEKEDFITKSNDASTRSCGK